MLLLRNSGHVESFDDLRPGDHVGWAVDARADYPSLLRSCLAMGRRENEKLFAFGPTGGIPGCDDDVVLVDPHEAFLGRGPFAPDRMLDTFREATEQAHREGFRRLRVFADMDWLTAPKPSAEDVAAFELRLDRLVAELGHVVVCAYRRGTFRGTDLEAVMTAHPLVAGVEDDAPGFRMWHMAPRQVAVAGEIDFFNAARFERLLRSLLEDEATLRLDLAQGTFFDLEGMRALARAARQVSGASVEVRHAGDTFRRCWGLLEMNDTPRCVVVG